MSVDFGSIGERASEEQVSLVLVIRERRHKMTGHAGSEKGNGVPFNRKESGVVH